MFGILENGFRNKKKNILEAFHYCDENKGITCDNLQRRLQEKYKYICIVIQNPKNWSYPLKGFMESYWKCNDDNFHICIPDPIYLKRT
mmetsp:Transcript_24055/g.29403  ORF Transcript_24055/g.29403 Transcript_24055/m.29403 type:complete len:88 (-) Transcript_24055:275-538(-)